MAPDAMETITKASVAMIGRICERQAKRAAGRTRQSTICGRGSRNDRDVIAGVNAADHIEATYREPPRIAAKMEGWKEERSG